VARRFGPERELEHTLVRLHALLPLALTLAGTGCFDAYPVSLDLVVDDFEDGDLTPRSLRFDRWRCTGDRIDGFAVRAEDGRSPSLGCDFTVSAPWDRSVLGSATLSTRVIPTIPSEVVDLSSYVRLMATIKVTWAAGAALPADTTVKVELGCDGAASSAAGAVDGATDAGDDRPRADGGATDDSGGATGGGPHLSVSLGITAPNDWTPFPLELVTFGQPDLQTNQIRGGVSSCLAKVDSIRFIVRPSFADAEEAHGSLYLDDVRFQGAQAPR
jgi:hypothetical protein